MSETPERKVAYLKIEPADFGRLIDALYELPYKNAAPLIDLLQKSARAVFEDQLARIVPDAPPEDPPSTPPLENPPEGGA